MQGVIFDIKRFAIHDGPGIRTSVFFKGCPLKCWWCHNPESRSGDIQLIPANETRKEEKVGRLISSEKLMEEIRKDKVFYDHSKGGVTFSGGEPTLQLDFLLKMLDLCKEERIHSAVDTSGYLSQNDLNKLLPNTDLFLYDLKHMDAKQHQLETGVGNEQILNNLIFLNDNEAKIHVRIPFVPGFNDDVSHLEEISGFLQACKNVERIHLLPYHKLGQSKYKKFAINSSKDPGREPLQEEIEMAVKILSSYGHLVLVGG